MLDKTKPTIVNGINVDDINALINAVAEDPANGQTKWRVKSAWQGRAHNRSTVDSFHFAGEKVSRQFTIDIDEPEQLGGADAYANPQEHLLAAVNSCMMVGYVALCALQGIRLDHLEIEVSGDIDLRGFLGLKEGVAPGYESLDCTVNIKGDGTEAQFKEIHETVMKTSPNYYNLTKAVPLNAKLHIA